MLPADVLELVLPRYGRRGATPNLAVLVLLVPHMFMLAQPCLLCRLAEVASGMDYLNRYACTCLHGGQG